MTTKFERKISPWNSKPPENGHRF